MNTHTNHGSKPAARSRTLRFSRALMWLSTVLAAAPNLLALAFDYAADPTIGAAIADIVPMKYRGPFSALLFAVALRFRQLRYQTTQPVTRSDI